MSQYLNCLNSSILWAELRLGRSYTQIFYDLNHSSLSQYWSVFNYIFLLLLKKSRPVQVLHAKLAHPILCRTWFMQWFTILLKQEKAILKCSKVWRNIFQNILVCWSIKNCFHWKKKAEPHHNPPSTKQLIMEYLVVRTFSQLDSLHRWPPISATHRNSMSSWGSQVV